MGSASYTNICSGVMACEQFAQLSKSALCDGALSQRLWAKDASLWSPDADVQATIDNRLGWLTSADWLHSRLSEAKSTAQNLTKDGIDRVVLLGMGGSSLAPEVINAVYEGSQLQVLDNTAVGAVRDIRDAAALKNTVFVVASKSGSTIETAAFCAYFLQQCREDPAIENAGQHFVAITDPGSPMEKFAQENNFRAIFSNPADIGGRYSALSYFGMVPCILAGIDTDALQESARHQAANSRDAKSRDENRSRGELIGTALGRFATAGRDKLTLHFSSQLNPLGVWIEQLVAESTGKSGRGILPVVNEPLQVPQHYTDDRVFVYTHTAAEAVPQAELDKLVEAGHPVLIWTVDNKHALGGLFFDWEEITAVSAVALDVNPFDEPNVTESKQATQAVLDGDAQQSLSPDLIAAESGDTAARALEALLNSVGQGDYLAVLAYLPVDQATQQSLDTLMSQLNARLKAPVTLGIGPRFLHSTGQLHKGGANNGVFLQLVSDSAENIDIPGMGFGFATLNKAQATGDFAVLKQRDRRVAAIGIGEDVVAGLARVSALVEAAG